MLDLLMFQMFLCQIGQLMILVATEERKRLFGHGGEFYVSFQNKCTISDL